MELNYEDYDLRDSDLEDYMAGSQPAKKVEEPWIKKREQPEEEEEKKVYRKGDNKQTFRENGKTYVLPAAKIECKHGFRLLCCRQER